MATAGRQVADDWYTTFHTGLAAEFLRAAAATMAESDAALVARLLEPLAPRPTSWTAPAGTGGSRTGSPGSATA